MFVVLYVFVNALTLDVATKEVHWIYATWCAMLSFFILSVGFFFSFFVAAHTWLIQNVTWYNIVNPFSRIRRLYLYSSEIAFYPFREIFTFIYFIIACVMYFIRLFFTWFLHKRSVRSQVVFIFSKFIPWRFFLSHMWLNFQVMYIPGK